MSSAMQNGTIASQSSPLGGGTLSSLGLESVLDNFCAMLLEDYLQRKELKETLHTFRKERPRPNEDQAILSWYDIVLRLKLPDLLLIQHQRAPTLPESAALIEHLVMALARDSSLRNRQDMSVTLTGLASLQSQVQQHAQHTVKRLPTALRPLDPMAAYAVDNSNTTSPSRTRIVPPKPRPHSAGAHIATHNRDRKSSGTGLAPAAVNSNNNNNGVTNTLSVERYIPEDKRSRSLQRQFLTVKQLLEESRSLQKSLDREMRRLAVSELDRAKSQEALQTLHKVACGCCTMLFLPVNLPMKVSYKAVLDLRVKWSGRLSSKTIFTGIATDAAPRRRKNSTVRKGYPSNWETMTEHDRDVWLLTHDLVAEEEAAAEAEEAEEEAYLQELAAQTLNSGTHDMTAMSPSKSTKTTSVSPAKKAAMVALRQQAVPRCYDQVGVCVFCAQFFVEPETFRPSFQQIVWEEKQEAKRQQERREHEYWDPLRMVEKDRLRQERYQRRLEQQRQEEELQQKSQTSLHTDDAVSSTASPGGVAEGSTVTKGVKTQQRS